MQLIRVRAPVSAEIALFVAIWRGSVRFTFGALGGIENGLAGS